MHLKLVLPGRVWFVSALLAVFVTPAHCSESGSHSFGVKKGYICLQYISSSVGGDFDGESMYYYPGGSYVQTAIVPELERAGGFQAAVGVRFPRIGLEVFHSKTNHEAFWLGLPVDVSAMRFGTNLLFYLSTRSGLQPFLLAGGYYHSLTAKGGSVELYWDSYAEDWLPRAEGDATYDGLGADLGPGLQYYFSSGFSIRAEALYSCAFCSTVKMVGDQSGTKMEEKMSANGYSLRIGIVAGF